MMVRQRTTSRLEKDAKEVGEQEIALPAAAARTLRLSIFSPNDQTSARLMEATPIMAPSSRSK